MVRTIERKVLEEDAIYAELAGLSTDSKPTCYATGSLFFEVDTGDAYFYNEAGTSWVKVGDDA